MKFVSQKRKSESEGGYTLIEVLICMGIFAIGFLAVANLQINSMRGNRSAREFTEAAMWADNKVEELLSKPFDDPDLVQGSHSSVEEGFTINWNVVDRDLPEDTDTVADLKEVSILLRTTDGGVDKNVRLFLTIPRDDGE